jgi:transposase
MSGKRYTEEFKIEAVKQVTDRGYSAGEVAKRLGVTSKSLGDWIKRYGDQSSQHQTISTQQEELRRLKAELRRVTEERDILKEAAAFFASESKRSTRS